MLPGKNRSEGSKNMENSKNIIAPYFQSTHLVVDPHYLDDTVLINCIA